MEMINNHSADCVHAIIPLIAIIPQILSLNYQDISTADLSCTSIMPPKRKSATPSRKRTPKKSRKAGASHDIHYPGGGLQTSFAVEGMSLLIVQCRC
jgi:hypothetical protein